MARQGIKRAVFVAGAVALASSTHAEAFEPPTEGIVSVRAAGGAPDTARLGFVAGGNGQVVAYVGSAMNGEDVAGAGFVVRVSDGTEFAGTGVAYDRAHGARDDAGPRAFAGVVRVRPRARGNPPRGLRRDDE